MTHFFYEKRAYVQKDYQQPPNDPPSESAIFSPISRNDCLRQRRRLRQDQFSRYPHIEPSEWTSLRCIAMINPQMMSSYIQEYDIYTPMKWLINYHCLAKSSCVFNNGRSAVIWSQQESIWVIFIFSAIWVANWQQTIEKEAIY
jgi:hypothetical protein